MTSRSVAGASQSDKHRDKFVWDLHFRASVLCNLLKIEEIKKQE